MTTAAAAAPIIVKDSLTCLEAALLAQKTGKKIEDLTALGIVTFSWGWTIADIHSRAATLA